MSRDVRGTVSPHVEVAPGFLTSGENQAVSAVNLENVNGTHRKEQPSFALPREFLALMSARTDNSGDGVSAVRSDDEQQ